MPTPDAIDRVRALHDHLEAEPHAALEPVRGQLRTAIEEPHDVAHYHSLSERLQGAYESVELEHPRLAALIQATINALNAAGI